MIGSSTQLRCTILLLLAVALAGRLSAQTVADDRYAREVFDVLRLPLEQISLKPEEWQVLRIEPAQFSGGATLENSTMKIQTMGRWTRLYPQESSAASGTYHFLSEAQHFRRGITPDDVYNPLHKGGVVVCKRQKEVIAESTALYLLPDAWAELLMPALTSYGEHEKLRNGQMTRSIERAKGR